NWALQVTHGFVISPEASHPEDDINRTTSSATHRYKVKKSVFFYATGLWCMNKIKNHDGENALLAEPSYTNKRWVLDSRHEGVQQSVEELNLDESIFGHDAIFPVNTFTLGTAYDIFTTNTIRTAIGIQFSLYNADARLNNLYGKNPMAAEVYLR